MTKTERIRAIHYILGLVRAELGPVADNLSAHTKLDHAQAMLFGFADDPRSMYAQVPMKIDGWCLDYWPKYPDWVKDDAHV